MPSTIKKLTCGESPKTQKNRLMGGTRTIGSERAITHEKILIIEDDENLSCGIAFEKDGFSVFTASTIQAGQL